jgi:hypothetical protein
LPTGNSGGLLIYIINDLLTIIRQEAEIIPPEDIELASDRAVREARKARK